MNRDFIQLKQLDGELKWSQKKTDYGITVSTKELVFHKPHLNYHLKFDDVISITPCELKERRVTLTSKREENVEYVRTTAFQPSYRVYVRKATIHNRSAQYVTGPMQFVLPLAEPLLKVVGQYSGLNQF